MSKEAMWADLDAQLEAAIAGIRLRYEQRRAAIEHDNLSNPGVMKLLLVEVGWEVGGRAWAHVMGLGEPEEEHGLEH
jgi:hypothetical protein